nr:hypothetical protein [Tanacetum cinerariifolium]
HELLIHLLWLLNNNKSIIIKVILLISIRTPQQERINLLPGKEKKLLSTLLNNLRTSSNTSRANQDNSPRIHRNAGYEGQRSGTVAGARDIVGSSMVQKSGIQCYNYKEYGHVARECQKPKRAKDAAYHREKMLLSHYMYMAKLQQVSPDVDDFETIFDKEPEQK